MQDYEPGFQRQLLELEPVEIARPGGRSELRRREEQGVGDRTSMADDLPLDIVETNNIFTS